MKNQITLSHQFNEVANQDWLLTLQEKIKQANEILQEVTSEDFISDYSLENFKLFLEKITLIDVFVQHYFGVIAHLNSVVNDSSKREAYQNCLQMISQFSSELAQNQALYRQFKKFSQAQQNFPKTEKKIIENFIIDFEKSGVSLEKEKKEKLINYSQSLAKNSSDFFNHVLDDTNEFILFVEDKNILEKMPQQDLERAQNLAIEKKMITENQQGFAFTMQSVDFINFMKYCSDSNKRKEMYTAYTTRATKGERDNTAIVLDTLKKRSEKAKLLNYSNHIEYTLVDRMAKSKKEITDFLSKVLEKAYSFALKEIEELKEFALQNGYSGELCRWDTAYWSEMLKKQKYDYDNQELRNYFPYEKVFQGLFNLTEKLFGYQLKQKKDIDVWHPEVEGYEILDKQNNLQGVLFIDLFNRKDKGQGAWVNTYATRHVYRDGKTQLPVGYLICNFSPKDKDGQSYLFHDEIVTLFHEMGHALHMCLTQIEYSQVSSGSGVPWDGIELPSQFFENFSWNYEILSQMSEHKETKQTLPVEFFEKLVASKNFQTGMGFTRQIQFALIDLELHDLTIEELNQQDIVKNTIEKVKEKTNFLKEGGFERFENAFSHIFSGGYSAGYYSYLWALVYACDAFDAFLDKDGKLDYSIGEKFLDKLLSKGGNEDFKKLYLDFRGKDADVEPLFKQNGLY